MLLVFIRERELVAHIDQLSTLFLLNNIAAVRVKMNQAYLQGEQIAHKLI